MRNRPAAAALLLAATALAAGCNGSDDPTTPPDTTISGPPTAEYLETSEQTVTEAVPRNLSDGEAEDFYTESLLKQDREFKAQMEEQGIKQQGTNKILWSKQLEYQNPDIGDEQTMVAACVERNLRFLDKDGNDITADQQGNSLEKGAKTLIHYTLTTPDEGKTWLIDSWTEKGECTAEQQS
ncbi:hypothetical protein IGS73_07395 [Janibacter indicus]|uniref:DUF3828 domain-containing protein n=1 Tax=Janibacter indicus TaxID=857417 RepID=A0A7L9J486_9MICO|nr:hypothetical protein [Janibacter indicus]QOK24174.1 hypothetical protein IGS73_07395 [Janibacter indicus]